MLRVGQRAEVLDELLELREVERSAGDAGDRAGGVEDRHRDGDDRHVRQPAEDDVGDRELPGLHRVDEVFAIADRRRLGIARREDLADDAQAVGDEDREEARVDVVIVVEQRLAPRAVGRQAGQRRGQRLDGVLVIVDVGADVLVQRRDRLVQPAAAVLFLLGRRSADRPPTRAPAPAPWPPARTRGTRRRADGAPAADRRSTSRCDERGARDQVGDDDRHQSADDQLQRDRQDRVAQVADAVEARHRDQRCRPPPSRRSGRRASASARAARTMPITIASSGRMRRPTRERCRVRRPRGSPPRARRTRDRTGSRSAG